LLRTRPGGEAPELTPEKKKLAAEAEKLDGEVGQLFQRGQAADAVVKAHKALEIRRKLFRQSKYPDGHPDLAVTLNDLGFVLQAMGSFEKALTLLRGGGGDVRKLYPASKVPRRTPRLCQQPQQPGDTVERDGLLCEGAALIGSRH